MTDTYIANYLIENYYSKYAGTRTDIVPTVYQAKMAYRKHKDKFLIVRDDKIKGIGIFLTLSDETYALLREYDITDVKILAKLLLEHGPNVHFVLLVADGKRTILSGIREVKEKLNPKTISWWNPDLTYLHKYKTGV